MPATPAEAHLRIQEASALSDRQLLVPLWRVEVAPLKWPWAVPRCASIPLRCAAKRCAWENL